MNWTFYGFVTIRDLIKAMSTAKKDTIDSRRFQILVSDRTEAAANRNRRELFESIMTNILSIIGYRVDRVRHADPNLMELDIEGKHRETGTPLYAVCRYSETAVSERDLQAFYGRYMVRWHEDKQCHGVFVVLPGFDEPAGKYYRQCIKNNDHVTTFLYEENDILKLISELPEFDARIPPYKGETAESILLYTKRGMFWVMLIISHGKNTPDKIALFDGKGEPISDRSIIAYIMKLCPSFAGLKPILTDKTVLLQAGLFPDSDPVVEVSGSDKCFEFPLPASPKHFVGRKSFFDILDILTHQVIHHQTKDRGIVIEAPMGWGKSSMLLASAAHVEKNGHPAVAVDCRTASSSTFISRVIDYTALKFGDLDGRSVRLDQKKSTPALAGAVQRILDIGQKLESLNKVMFIFFDQFEHVFFRPNILCQIKDFFLTIFAEQPNIIMGFSWDSGFVFSRQAFSDHEFDTVTEKCRKMILPAFSNAEIDALLKRLAKELDEPLTKDLQYFLHIFSQGYPWLLKILCFHVKIACQSGIPQPAIPEILLGIEELFQQDFQHLSDAECNTLHQIAESVPGRFSSSCETVDHQVIQSLVRRGLIKSIGTAVVVSSNILRHYLNAGELPFRNHFLFITAIGKVVDALKILYDADGILDAPGFKIRTAMPAHAFYGLARDMDLAGLVTFGQGKVFLKRDISDGDQELAAVLRNSLRRRLSDNRSVSEILKILKNNRVLTMTDISTLLGTLSPWIKIQKRAWLTHAQMLSQWLDAADLALLDKINKKLVYFDPESEIRERDLFLPRRRGGKTPRVPYAPIETVAVRLVQALQGNGIVDWTGLSKNTIFDALAALEDLGFIQRKTSLIKVLPRAKAFFAHPDQRQMLFAEGALQLRLFSMFIEILKSKQTMGSTLSELGRELREIRGASWEQGTSKTIAKIMLNWARHANLAPGAFKKIRKGPIKGWKKKKDYQLSLF
jgi:hypothetical protein